VGTPPPGWGGGGPTEDMIQNAEADD